jgi:hypothetical protein
MSVRKSADSSPGPARHPRRAFHRASAILVLHGINEASVTTGVLLSDVSNRSFRNGNYCGPGGPLTSLGLSSLDVQIVDPRLV